MVLVRISNTEIHAFADDFKAHLSDRSAVKILIFISYQRQSKVCYFTCLVYAYKYISGGQITVKDLKEGTYKLKVN